MSIYLHVAYYDGASVNEHLPPCCLLLSHLLLSPLTCVMEVEEVAA